MFAQDERPEMVQRIGIADGALVYRPMRLRTSGLGSCIGLVVFDVFSGMAGMVHIMLPVAPTEPKPNQQQAKPQKYADLGVEWLVREMQNEGAALSRLRAKMAGGAQMFTFAAKTDILRVGPRNIEAVRIALDGFGIPIVSEDVGGKEGRTIEFDSQTQMLMVRTAKSGIVTI